MDKSVAKAALSRIEANERGTGRTTRMLERAVQKLRDDGGTVFVIIGQHSHFGMMVSYLVNIIPEKLKIGLQAKHVIIPNIGKIQFVNSSSPMYNERDQRLYGEDEDRVFLDHTVIEQYCRKLVNGQFA